MIYYAPSRERPVLSILTLVRDEWPLLERCLRLIARDTMSSYEVIVVENAGDSGAAEHAAETMRRYQMPGVVIKLDANIGFAAGNNFAARHAIGEYICLLNPDTEPPAGWAAPMLDFLEKHEDVWITGNYQVYPDGRLQSVGSEFSAEHGCFVHVRREETFAPDAIPPEVLTPVERDMVTGACLLIRRDRWERLDGFDEAYSMLYDEDTDLCMRVRREGGRIFYVPTPPMKHVCGASGGAPNGTAFKLANAERFRKQWVETGRVFQYAKRRGVWPRDGAKIRAGYIVLNEEHYLAASVASIIDFVDEVVLVPGATHAAREAGLCDKRGRPRDLTLTTCKTLAAKYSKVRVLKPRIYCDKAEQRQAYCSGLKNGDWLFVVDGDEVWYEKELWRLAWLMENYEAIIPGYWSFWNDVNTVGTGAWDTFNSVRLLRWREHYCYDASVHEPGFGPIQAPAGPLHDASKDRMFAHYGWVKPVAELRKKYAYYQNRTGGRGSNYIDDVFLGWRENLGSIERGTHVVIEGGGAARFAGKHPSQVQVLIDEGWIGGKGW